MNNSGKSGPCEIQPQVKLPAFVYTFPWEVDWRTLTLSGCEVRVFDRNNSSGIKQVLYVLTATAATVATSKTPHTNRSLSLADSHGSSATQIPSCCSFSTWLQLHHFQKSHQRRGNGQKMMEKGGWRDWVREPDQPRVTVTASAFLISRSAPKQSHFFGDTLKALLQRCARSSGATNWPETEPFPHTGRPLLCNVRKPFLARSGKTSSFQSESACVQNS